MILKNGKAKMCDHIYYDENNKQYLTCHKLGEVESGGMVYCMHHFKINPNTRCLECHKQTAIKVDYNGHGHWVCPSCDARLEREFETFEN